VKTIYVAAALLLVTAAGLLFAYPAIASAAMPQPEARFSGGMPNQVPFHGGPAFAPFGGPPSRGGGGHGPPTPVTVSNGQVITVTSTKGEFRVVGDRDKNGTASGTLTFTVAGKLSGGYIMSIGGSITVNGTTYTVSSGSGRMSPFANSISGQGTTSSGGTYLLDAAAHGDFTGASTANVGLDFGNGTTEYAVTLAGTIQG
jgi:hypothetical protein